MIGEYLSILLEDIENTLINFECDIGTKPNFTDEGFRASIKIFMAAMLDKMWELQSDENIDQSNREEMAVKVGRDLRKLVKIYTNIDAHDLYKHGGNKG